MRFLQYIHESKQEIKHLEHLEDLLVTSGSTGIIALGKIINEVYSAPKSKGKIYIQIKVDGAPALVWGSDPRDNQFFVSTKSAFNKTPKLIKNLSDVSGFNPGIQDKLSYAFKLLGKLKYSPGEAYQGDVLFLGSDKKMTNLEGESYLTFTPNVITYALKSGSEMFNRAKRAKLGLVVHTKYVIRKAGDSIGFSQQKLNFGSILSKASGMSDLFIMDNVIKGSDIESQDFKNESEVRNLYSELASTFNSLKSFYSSASKNKVWPIFQQYINSTIISDNNLFHDAKGKKLYYNAESTLENFIRFAKGKGFNFDLSKSQMSLFVYCYFLAAKIKYLIFEEFANLSLFDKKLVGSNPVGEEGYVLVGSKNVVKIIDRNEFSRMNKLLGKFRK